MSPALLAGLRRCAPVARHDCQDNSILLHPSKTYIFSLFIFSSIFTYKVTNVAGSNYPGNRVVLHTLFSDQPHAQ